MGQDFLQFKTEAWRDLGKVTQLTSRRASFSVFENDHTLLPWDRNSLSFCLHCQSSGKITKLLKHFFCTIFRKWILFYCIIAFCSASFHGLLTQWESFSFFYMLVILIKKAYWWHWRDWYQGEVHLNKVTCWMNSCTHITQWEWSDGSFIETLKIRTIL